MMEIDIVWLLVLPLLFALGWIAARYDWGQQRRESKHVPKDILNSMSAVLCDDFKNATDLLLSAAVSAPDSVELYRAVGNLYRKRGLVDRAIEVHERALQHPDAPTSVRIALMLDLGRDYLAAGLFDRAQAVLEDLLALTNPDPEARHEARNLLLTVAERTRNWSAAIVRARELRADSGSFGAHAFEQLMGHYHCELAQLALEKGDIDTALKSLDSAQTFATTEGPTRRVAMMRQQIDATTKATSSGTETASNTFINGETQACKVCGFRSNKIYWQCPGCHHWDSFSAVK